MILQKYYAATMENVQKCLCDIVFRQTVVIQKCVLHLVSCTMVLPRYSWIIFYILFQYHDIYQCTMVLSFDTHHHCTMILPQYIFVKEITMVQVQTLWYIGVYYGTKFMYKGIYMVLRKIPWYYYGASGSIKCIHCKCPN